MPAQRDVKGKASRDDLVEWFTVSYRTLYGIGGVLVAILAVVGYWYYRRHSTDTPPVRPLTSVTSAKFVAIEGTVQMKEGGALRWENATTTTVLNKADLVRTGAGSSAEIKFFNGAVFHVRPDSVFIIEETSEDPASKQRRAAVKIQSGEVNFQVPQRNVPGSATMISTPTVITTAADEAEGNVNVAGNGGSAIRMVKGSIDGATSAGDHVTIAANEGLKVDAQGKAGPKVTLPGIPVLQYPQSQAEIAYPNPAEATTLLSWKAASGAATYHVLLDYTPSFNRPVVERKEWKPLSMELSGLDAGTYYWQVAAMDKDGTQGNYSEASRFVLSQGGVRAIPPPLTLEPLVPRGNAVQIKGRTAPGAVLSVNGQTIEVRPDGSFNEFLTLAVGRQEVVLRATGPGGGVAEQRRAVVVPD